MRTGRKRELGFAERQTGFLAESSVEAQSGSLVSRRVRVAHQQQQRERIGSEMAWSSSAAARLTITFPERGHLNRAYALHSETTNACSRRVLEVSFALFLDRG
jgi:hypothetical protein